MATATYEVITSNGNKLGVITLTNPPVNSLSAGVRIGIQNATEKIKNDSEIKGVIIRGANNIFCAGADITEFKNLTGPNLNDVITSYESLNVPVVAAIEGFAFGGGLEVALGAHYRVSSERAKLGLPEVNLGLLPGAGGTQRLPRVSGNEFAVHLMVTGVPVSAAQAKKVNLVDLVVPSSQNVFDAAVLFIQDKIGSNVEGVRSRNRSIPGGFDNTVFEKAKKVAKQQRRNEIAPGNIIKAVEAANTSKFEDGINTEGLLFQELLGAQSRALQHMFFSERLASKVENISKNVKAVPIKSLGIIGAGLMGGGIAMSAANVGISVVLIDINQAAVDNGLKLIVSNYNRSLSKGSLTQELMNKRLGLIKGSVNYEDLKDVDMVIEAVFENMNIKKEVFKKLDQVCKKDAFLCTNTSYLNIDEIASAASRPENVIGTHFFSPANVMKLLENVRGSKTSDQTILTVMEFGKKISKIPTLVGNCHGFVGNRMLEFYSQQASLMLLEGSLPHIIDRVAYNFGMPMGPFQMIDLVGLDLSWRERKRDGIADPNKNVTDSLCENGRLGQKTKKGYYNYDENRNPSPDSYVEETIVTVSKNLNIKRREINEKEILERLFYPLINEGFKILEEGIAQRPSDIDVVYVYGYGFPRYRGGPMFYADEVGLNNIIQSLNQLNITPANLLVDSAKHGSLQSYWPIYKKQSKAKL